MLAPGMIRKMGKAYTDRQMTKNHRVHYQVDAWSNGFIAFKEPPPKHIDLEYDNVVEHDFWPEVEVNMIEGKDLTQVWPVEIRPVASGDESKFAAGNYLSDSGKRLVRLSDGNGLTTWLDAGYLSAILKRQPTATFFTNENSVVVAKNGQPFAMVMPMVEDIKSIYDDSPWSIVNDDLDSARNFDTANELAALLPTRPGSKWHTVTHHGLSLEIRRSGRKHYPRSKERVLHVHMIGRDAMSHISLYDGRGVYHD